MLFKRIKYRIGFILFATLVFSLGGVLAHTYWTLKQRFLDYSTQNLEETIKPLKDDLIYAYQSDGSLDAYRDNPRLWEQSTRELLRNFRRPPPMGQPSMREPPSMDGPPPRGTDNLPPRSKDFPPRVNDFPPRTESGPAPDLRPKSGDKKTPWQETLRNNQRSFVDSLALYDTNLVKIAGNDEPLENLIQHTVTFKNSTLAIIAYKAPNFFVRSSEFLFLDQQLKSFGLIGVIGLILALIVASLVSKSISIPLTALAKTAKKIANGDFSARINNTANDEIGDICENFNAMANKLEAHELSRKRWVADISHEMRTPLAVLKAQVEAIEDGVRPANKENLALLTLKINSINHLINDLYELSLFDIGAMRCNKELLNIELLVQDFMDDHIEQLQADNFNVELIPLIPSNYTAPNIFADRERITQLLNNILQNTKRYTDRPGKIRWSLKQDERSITLKFEDSSPSIDSNKIDKIFDRLYRTDESRSRERGGAGLGLSICKGIVELHEGTIKAQISSVGGIAIIVNFPRV